MYFRLKLCLETLLVSKGGIGWKMKETIKLKYDVMWV